MDVPEVTNQHERRFVLSDLTPSERGIPTPPTSEDERVRKARRKPSELTIDGHEKTPEISKRTASPYAISNPAKLQRDGPLNTSLGAIDTLVAPSHSGAPAARNPHLAPSPISSSPRRDSTRLSGGDYFNPKANSDDAVDDSRYDRRYIPELAKGKRVTDQALAESPQTSTFDFAPPAGNASIRRVNLDARRNTDPQNTLPTLSRLNIDKSRRPNPLMASSSLSEAQDMNPIPSSSLDPRSAGPYPRSRESSYTSSRGPSPVGSAYSGSPRLSAEFTRDGNVFGSKPPSATSSRPASPSPRTPGESPRLARTDLDWSTLLAANAARRSKPPSRLGATAPQDPASDVSHRKISQTNTPLASSLPYPEDDSLMGSTIYMPEEQDHAYHPTHKASLASPPTANDLTSFEQSSSPSSSGAFHITTKPSRPTLVRGYTANTPSTPEPRSADAHSPRPLQRKRTESFATTSEARKEIAALMSRGLPPCHRRELVAGYDDWYTITGATNIDFCPDCIDTLFERTTFRSQFRRSLPRNLQEKVRCAFGSPWLRLAWLLTLQQQRTDLSLLKDVAGIEETTEPCPGSVETVQSWYGLRDPDGLFVRDFHLCYGDVRKIERLLPTLSGIFVRLPHRASYEKRTCAIRTDSTRFSVYLDALVSTHENAVASRKGADQMPLIDLVERKTRLRECTRDNILINGLWHFIPDLPALTVCEDCFESVVEPEIKKGSSVAKRFNRTVQPVYGEGIGSSCQLYSRRMRKVFLRAVEEADGKYLARKAKERREAELWLQDRYKDVLRKAERLSLEGPVSGEDERRLTRDLEKISGEWKGKWE